MSWKEIHLLIFEIRLIMDEQKRPADKQEKYENLKLETHCAQLH